MAADIPLAYEWCSSRSLSSSVCTGLLSQLAEGADHNRFVCLQLATMAKEACRKCTSEPKSAVPAWQQPVFVVQQAASRPVGGAVFRLRPGALTRQPEAYLELMATSEPGRGYGAALLRCVEHLASLAIAQLSERAGAEAAPPGSVPCVTIKLISVGAAEGFYARRGYGPPDSRHEMAKLLQ